MAIGSQPTAVWASGSLTIGANTYAALRGITMNWGYDILKEPVMFSQTPFYGTQEFRGAVDVESIYVTDQDLTALIALTNGQLPSTTVTLVLTNSAATPASDTLTNTSGVKFNNVEITGRQLGFVTLRASGDLIQAPILT